MAKNMIFKVSYSCNQKIISNQYDQTTRTPLAGPLAIYPGPEQALMVDQCMLSPRDLTLEAWQLTRVRGTVLYIF